MWRGGLLLPAFAVVVHGLLTVLGSCGFLWSPPEPCTSLPDVQPRGPVLPIYPSPQDKKKAHPFNFDQQGATPANGGHKEHRPHKTPLLNFFGFGGMGGDAMEA